MDSWSACSRHQHTGLGLISHILPSPDSSLGRTSGQFDSDEPINTGVYLTVCKLHLPCLASLLFPSRPLVLQTSSPPCDLRRSSDGPLCVPKCFPLRSGAVDVPFPSPGLSVLSRVPSLPGLLPCLPIHGSEPGLPQNYLALRWGCTSSCFP